MVDQIHPDGLVLSRLDRHLQLRPDPVGAAHQDRPAERAGGRQVVETAERADLGQDPFLEGAARDQADPLDGPHLGVDVDAGVLVGERPGRGLPLNGGLRGPRRPGGALAPLSLHARPHVQSLARF